MIFRHVRNSRDVYSGFGLTIFVPAVIIAAFFFFREQQPFDRTMCGVVLGLFSLCTVCLLRFILFPLQWELVVENNEIRWGRVDRPERQQHIAVDQLVRLINDETDQQVLGDIGSWRYLRFSDNVLMSATDRNEFVGRMRENFPRLNIETR